MSINIDGQNLLIGNIVGAYTLIKGYTDVYTNLPDATTHDGEFWFVQDGSSPRIPLTNWYRYPAGLYISVDGVWSISPFSVEYSETTGVIANVTSWSDFYPYLEDIKSGSQIIFGGKTYTNITGSVSTTAPDLDTTNWASKILVENILTDTGDLTIKTALDYTLLLENPVYEDLNFDPAIAGGPTPTQPDDVTINNVFYKEFTSSNNQYCGAGEEIPHHYKLSSAIQPHMHIFLKSGESAGTTGVSFTMYWSYRESDQTLVNGSVVLTATSAQLTANPVKFDLYGAPFTGPDVLGTQLNVAIYRTAGNAGDVIVTTFGVHYAIDTIGSRQIAVK